MTLDCGGDGLSKPSLGRQKKGSRLVPPLRSVVGEIAERMLRIRRSATLCDLPSRYALSTNQVEWDRSTTCSLKWTQALKERYLRECARVATLEA